MTFCDPSPFTRFEAFSPPRPEKAIPSRLLDTYEERGWIAQFKKNGIYTVLYVTPDKRILAKTRKETDLVWTPPAGLSKQFSHLNDAWYVFCCEHLHYKTKTIKDRLYLFDVLVFSGERLTGERLADRLQRLQGLFPCAAQAISAGFYVSSPNIWIAQTLTGRFREVYEGLSSPEDEGLVLKDPRAPLEPCGPSRNKGWQVKCLKGGM